MLTIPNEIDGYPVTSIGSQAFYYKTNLIELRLSSALEHIGAFAFLGCCNLANLSVPDSVTFAGSLAFAQCSGLTNVVIGNGPTFISDFKFADCGSLLKVEAGTNLTSIDEGAFAGCTSLAGVYLPGSAPGCGPRVFDGATNCTIYYLPGKTGWGANLATRPSALWLPCFSNPEVEHKERVSFGFDIIWSSGMTFVVEAPSDPGRQEWLPVATNTILAHSSHFNDRDWITYPSRLYRLRSW